MPPKDFASAKVTLSYPLCACDFDPSDATTLVVGGGGGAGRSGVGNKITAFDTSNPHELEQTAEVDLSKDEDNVTTLVVGQSKGMATMIYAGINSSLADREKGKNEHFRVFGLQRPVVSKNTQTTAGAKIVELLRSSLFEGTGAETYQRVLRLSAPFPGFPQLGAAATEFASNEDEIVLFDTAGSTATSVNIQGRVKVNKAAEDVDVIQTGADEYLFAYCTKFDIFVKSISSNTIPSDPACITQPTTKEEMKSKPLYRSLRFLSPEFLLVLTNLHGRSGAILQILRLPVNEGMRATQALQIRLPSNVRQATGLAVCNLSPRTAPSEAQGYATFVIAVAGHDMSISLLTAEYQREGLISMVTKLKYLRVLKEVHPFQITGLTLSTFTTPKVKTSLPRLKLASISAGNTVVVHTIPVSPIPKTAPTRYTVSGSAERGLLSFSLIVSILATLLLAFFVQVILEVRGVSPALLNASNYVAPDVQGWARYSHPIANRILGAPKPTISAASSPAPTRPANMEISGESLADTVASLISQQGQSPSQASRAPIVIIREDSLDSFAQSETSAGLKSSIRADVHDEEVHGPHGGKMWDELTHQERERWTKKLKEAGHWTEDFAETILKSVFWGVVGGAVGNAVGG